MFESFPYTNYHNLNLDWILKRFHDYEETLQNFVSLNTIKYADPFDWDITRQYSTNTIVMDPRTGIAYISVQPVPAGAQITDTDYWTPVFDLSLLFEGIKDSIAALVEESDYATENSTAGTLIWVGNTLYRSTVDIAAGSRYVSGGNVERITIEELINGLQNALDAEREARTQADTAINNNITAINTRIDNLKLTHDHATRHLYIYVADTNSYFQWTDPNTTPATVYEVLEGSCSDNNTGLDPTHPVRTLTRAFEVMAEHAAGAYIEIVHSGTYDMGYPVINAAQIHLQSVAEGTVEIDWGWNTAAWTLAFYDCYIHLNGQADTNPLILNMTCVSDKTRNAYLEAGKIYAQDVIFRTSNNMRFGVVGGYGQFLRCRFETKVFVSSGNVIFSTCTFAPPAQNTMSTVALQVYNGASITFAEGTYFTIPSDRSNITAFLSAGAAYLDVRNTAPAFTGLDNSVILNQSYIVGNTNRVWSWLGQSTSGVFASITASLVNGIMMYPNGSGKLLLYNNEIPHSLAFNGQTLQNTGVLLFSPGYFTDSGTNLRMQIPLGYTIPDNASLTFTKLEIQVRDSIGAVLNPTDLIANPDAYSLQTFVKNNIVYVRVTTDADHAFKHGSTVVTNHTICVVAVTYVATVTYSS